jgi:hypothetical protein
MTRRLPRGRRAALAALTVSTIITATAAAALASETADWRFADATDFRSGELDGLALHPERGLTVAPSLQRIEVEAELVHCWTRSEGVLWLGTGIGGQVFRVEGKGKGAKAVPVAKLDSPLVASLVPDGAGGVYAGLIGKEAQVVRVDKAGKVSPVVSIAEANHVWALRAHGRQLFAGTGPHGAVWRIDTSSKKATLHAETGAEHVLALIADGPDLVAGTAEPAMLLRVPTGAGKGGKAKATALAAFPGSEVRSVVRHGDALYASVTAARTRKPPKPTADRPGEDKDKPKSKAARKKAKAKKSKGKGAVWMRRDDGLIMPHFVSPEGLLTELGAAGRGIFAGAARDGRVVVGDEHLQVESLFDLDEQQVIGLEMQPADPKTGVSGGPRTLFVGGGGAVYVVGSPRRSATFTSRVLNAAAVARWGRIELVGTPELRVETRTGFSADADETWSAWQPLDKAGRVLSPPSVYLQVRVSFPRQTSTLRELRIHRRLINRPPLVGDIETERQKGGLIEIKWKAEDPDKDKLGFVITYRKAGTTQWLRLHDRYYPKKKMTLAPTDMPDGYYEVRIEADDMPSNPAGENQRTARISAPFLVDRGLPQITGAVKGGRVEGMAADATSNIVRVEVSIDGEPTAVAVPGDGLFDSAQEAFAYALPEHARKGTHTLLITATDEADNVGVLRLVYGR